jgi:hypothetical protein
MRILTILLYTALAAFLILAYTGCDNSDDGTAGVPWEPTDDKLNDGPGEDAEFVHWNSTGHTIVDSLGTSVQGWCYAGQESDIDLGTMAGLHVNETSLAEDSLQCTLTIADADYAQIEYSPDGVDWADSVSYWVDTTCVTLPSGLTAADVQFYWYDRDEGIFVPIETRITGSGHWLAKTMHFSRYVLGKRVNAN